MLALVGPPGTNKVMAGELSRVARRALPGVRLATPRKQGTGALEYPFDPALANVAVAYHRTSARVLWTVMTSTASRLEPLYDDLRAQMATQTGWLWDGASFSIRVRNVDAFAAGARQIVGAVKNAIIDGAPVSLRVDPDRPDVYIDVRMHEHEVAVSVDLSGTARNKRGYRMHAGAAPLRETLASALVMLARHDSRSEPLVDPMAGSGTIAIEAALMARGMPLRATDAAHLRLPAFAGVAKLTEPLFGDTRPRVLANEIDRATAKGLRANVAAAGAQDYVSVNAGDFRSLSPESVAAIVGAGPGVIATNPPYGERIGDRVTDLYRDFGDWLRQFRGWRAAVIVANREFEACMRMRPRIKKPLSARPFRGYVYVYEV